MSRAQGSGLRELLERRASEALVVPGVGCALEAVIAESCSFSAVYVSGYATAAVQHGVPDIGLIGCSEMVQNVTAISQAVGVPLIADADTGYGDIANVRSTVRRLEAAGASGIQIEDQTWPKRCGHMAGKQVESAEVMLRKIDAALNGRRDEQTVIIARTDARQPLGLDEAIDRATRYSQAGADVTFVDAPESVAELERVGREVPGIKLVNMSETGQTPLLSAQQLKGLGFDIVLFPTSATRVLACQVQAFLRELLHDGDSRGWLERMLSLRSLNDLLGLARFQALEEKYLEPPAGRIEP
jgi:2-methylisocitrate lyase-like PEP mutase family enzyme